MSEVFQIIFSSFWTFAGTLILVGCASFSLALSFYWLTRYRELRQEQIEQERIERIYQVVRQISGREPFN
jgi:uncharacterized lipoprotein YmbA